MSARTMMTDRQLRPVLLATLLMLVFVLSLSTAAFAWDDDDDDDDDDAPAIDVQCGDELDIDDGRYKLNSDLVCPFNPSFAAVTITGKGVDFNLAGHTIQRADDGGPFLSNGIAVRAPKAHIYGGSVVDFNCPVSEDPETPEEDCAAIRLFDAPRVRINGMSMHNNVVGIISFTFDFPDFGLSIGNADKARIHENDITGNLRFGVGLFSSAKGARFLGNDFSHTGGFSSGGTGYLSNSDDVRLIGNVANNCANSGIILFGNPASPPAVRNTVRHNTTLDNQVFGIGLGGFSEEFRARDNLIQGNTSFGNGFLDLAEGIRGTPTDDCLNTWKDNEFGTAAPDCIFDEGDDDDDDDDDDNGYSGEDDDE